MLRENASGTMPSLPQTQMAMESGGVERCVVVWMVVCGPRRRGRVRWERVTFGPF